MLNLATFAPLALLPLAQAAYTTYTPGSLPATTVPGQFGTNDCDSFGASSQDSLCQNLFLNSIDDFCVYGPPYSDGFNASIGLVERETVSYCTKAGYGTRLIPDGTLTAVHFVKTPDYVQITALGDFTKIGIPAGDPGGELDPHGFDQLGNPMGGQVFTSAFGKVVQTHEWAMFIGASAMCVKACLDGTGARQRCPHIYDEMGCSWNMPASYTDNVFETCDGDDAEFAGIYVGSDGLNTTFTQGNAFTPDAKPIPSSSNCVTTQSIPTNGAAAFVTPSGASPSPTTSAVETIATTDSAGSTFTTVTVHPATGVSGASATGAAGPGNLSGGSSSSSSGSSSGSAQQQSDNSAAFRLQAGLAVLFSVGIGAIAFF
ncbi:hypothetical protein BT69DRAFT_1279154 [Atractiella rhizophila]|nr:hypothetical protein BT69DRAFT_1279154 [Atractiella rhizophila]